MVPSRTRPRYASQGRPLHRADVDTHRHPRANPQRGRPNAELRRYRAGDHHRPAGRLSRSLVQIEEVEGGRFRLELSIESAQRLQRASPRGAAGAAMPSPSSVSLGLVVSLVQIGSKPPAPTSWSRARTRQPGHRSCPSSSQAPLPIGQRSVGGIGEGSRPGTSQ
jgi:hypothetical protein